MTAVSPAQIRALQATRRAAGIDDDAWRDRLRSRFDVASTKLLTASQAHDLLDELRRARPDPIAGPYGAKARALWISAWQLGLADDRRDAALLAFVERQTGFRTFAWVRDPKDGRAVVEALKAWLAREGGVDWSIPDPKLTVFTALRARLAARRGAVTDDELSALSAAWHACDRDGALTAAGKMLRRVDAGRRSP